jgi:L-cysteine desulfidase
LKTTKSLEDALVEAKKEIVHLQVQCDDLTSQNEKVYENANLVINVIVKGTNDIKNG